MSDNLAKAGKTIFALRWRPNKDLIAILAALASAGGLLCKGLYRDNAFVTTTWLGNDAVTLFLAVPILVAALFFSARGSLRAQLVWLGMLDYVLYGALLFGNIEPASNDSGQNDTSH